MRKATRKELDQLRADVVALTSQVREIATALGMAPMYMPEQKAATKWVHKDSEEWKAYVESQKAQQSTFAAYARTRGGYSGIEYNTIGQERPWWEW